MTAIQPTPMPQYRFDRRRDFLVSLVIGLVALAIGAIGVFRVLFAGNHGNLTSYVPWGLLVSVYVYLVWMEVGMILGYYALRHVVRVDGIERLGPVIVTAAIAALLAALLIIGMDLGHPFRAFRAFYDPNPRSLMTWMIWLHTFYLGLLIVEFWAYYTDHKKLITWLNWVNIPAGVALIGVIGGLFGVVAARPFWNGSVLPMAFFMSSLIAGTGLIIILHLLFSPTAGTPRYVQTAYELARFFMWAILIGILAAGANLLITAYPSVPAKAEALNLMLFGPYWWSMWILHLLLGTLVPLVLLVAFRRSLVAIGIAAALMVLTFVVVPLNIVIPGLAYPSPDLYNLGLAFQDAYLHFNYIPAVNEWLVVLFGVGLALTLFAVAYRVLLYGHYGQLARKEAGLAASPDVDHPTA